MTITMYDLAGIEADRRFSPFCWRTKMALAHKGLDAETVPWRFTEKDKLPSPNQGRVPVICDRDRIIHDSTAIADYLDETYPDPPLQPQSGKEREVMHEWLRTATEIHVPAVKTLIYTRKIGKVLHKNEAEDAKYRSLQRDPELLAFHSRASTGIGLPKEQVDRAEAMLLRSFGMAEEELSQHAWLVGDQFSLADISWAPLHFTLAGVDFPFHRYPHVGAWADAIRERPSFQEGVLRWCPKF